MAQANVRLTVDATGATNALKSVQNQTTQLEAGVNRLKTAFAGIGLTVLAKQTIFAFTNLEKLTQRLKLLTEENGTFKSSVDLAREAQEKFGLSTTESFQAVTQLTARLAPLGVGFEDIRTILIGFNTAAITSGASMDEQRNAMIQLTQALGSGVLRGDEFNSISEQMNTILPAVAKVLNAETGELRELAAQGKITKEVMIEAFELIASESGDMLKELIKNDPTMVFKILGNETENLSIAVGRLLAPAVLDATRVLTKLINGLADFLDSEAGQVTTAFVGIGLAIKGVTFVVPIVIAQVSALKASFLTMSLASAAASGSLKTTTAMAFAASGGFAKATAAATAFKIALAKTGIGLAVIGLGLLITKLLEANNAQKDFNDLIKEGTSAMINQGIVERQAEISKLKKEIEDTNPVLKNLLDGLDMLTFATLTKQEIGSTKQFRKIKKLNDEINELKKGLKPAESRDLGKFFDIELKKINKANESLKKQNVLEKESTEKAKILADFKFEMNKLEEEKNKLLIANNGEMSEENSTKFKNLKLAIDDNKKLKLKNLEIKEANKNLKEQEQLFLNIGKSVEDGIVSNLADAVEGTKTLAQAAVSVLNDLKRSLIEVAIQKSIAGLGDRVGGFLGDVFKNLGKRANGGPVSAGGAFVVGEKGPEILQMGSRGGTIIPNNQLGGGTTNIVNVSVDAAGSAVSGNNQDAQALGNVIGAAIRAELIKEKRAGGLLSR